MAVILACNVNNRYDIKLKSKNDMAYVKDRLKMEK
jgi:hypothetical protein